MSRWVSLSFDTLHQYLWRKVGLVTGFIGLGLGLSRIYYISIKIQRRLRFADVINSNEELMLTL